MGSNDKEKIKITYDAIEDHILCSICLSVIRGAVLTPCGHRYCCRCITEWVGQKHSCPCCNSDLTASQFYCDVQFDSLVDDVLKQRDKAEEAFFDQMFHPAVTDVSNKSPFEEILKRHMKTSLLSHQRYFDKLREECHQKLALLDKGLNNCVHDEAVPNNVDLLKENLQKNLEESEKLVADAFDRYLTENVPSIEILPVKVTIYIADKDVRLTDVIVKPSENLSDIKPLIEFAMQEKCDDIIEWLDDSGIKLLFSPLAKSSHYNIDEVCKNLQKRNDVHSLNWDSRPVFQFNMRPGSEIVLKGVFKSQSDVPKRCFVNVFNTSGPQSVDYFSCNNCNLKWICKSCIQCCHKDHSVMPFVMNHVPTWACCYCPKKKMCTIQDK